jgi:citrate lyase subunit beta/citryl-CoA lyase
MSVSALRSCRSLLFLPASNARAIAKARTLPADLVILDCEDAVKEEDKDAAREAAMEAFREGFGTRPAALRINAPDRPWHADDLRAAAAGRADFVVLPKVEDPQSVEAVAAATGKPVLAMIETPAGILAAPAIARASAALLAGTNDLASILRIPPGVGREGLAYSLQAIVLAARSAGVAVFDGVYNRLQDDDGLVAECREGRAFGFDGKCVIHPSQIDRVNSSFAPDESDCFGTRRRRAVRRADDRGHARGGCGGRPRQGAKRIVRLRPHQRAATPDQQGPKNEGNAAEHQRHQNDVEPGGIYEAGPDRDHGAKSADTGNQDADAEQYASQEPLHRTPAAARARCRRSTVSPSAPGR